MQKLILMIFFVALSNPVTAEDQGPFCTSYYVLKWKDQVEQLNTSDKAKHCSLSCLVARRCDNNDILVFGLIKEMVDLIGPGNSEWEDMEANRQGVLYAHQSHRRCLFLCIHHYAPIFWK